VLDMLGGWLHLDTIEHVKDAAGRAYRVVYKLDSVAGIARNVAAFRGNPLIESSVPGQVATLLDGKGNRLLLVQGPHINQESGPDGQITRLVVTVVFRREPGQAEPARFQVTGTHAATIVVPFRFADVPLP